MRNTREHSQVRVHSIRFAVPFYFFAIALGYESLAIPCCAQSTSIPNSAAGPIARDPSLQKTRFEQIVAPFFKTHCHRCHQESHRESGIRVDHLDAAVPEDTLALWSGIQKQLETGDMPPEEETRPSDSEVEQVLDWIRTSIHAARSRPTPKNGILRRLTLSQYRESIKDLLGVDEVSIAALPPDPMSKDGFSNNGTAMILSPLQLETYLSIANQAVAKAIVDDSQSPTVQFFRMDLGKNVHPAPSLEKLVLGANNLLLPNSDFVVSEPALSKPFAFRPFSMQRKFRFIEGYQGNDTVREWRDFQGMHHAVFACMRGSEGYPKGLAYETVEGGLLLRPAIPSPEIFGESNTYGPHANFKISLRELPKEGKFRIQVRAAKYDDGLLIDAKHLPREQQADQATIQHGSQVVANPNPGRSTDVSIPEEGIYLISIELEGLARRPAPDASRLTEGLLAYFPFDSGLQDQRLRDDESEQRPIATSHTFEKTPFGMGLVVDGNGSNPKEQALSIPAHGAESPSRSDTTLRSANYGVGDGDFTIAAWIYPKDLRQGGIASHGGYGYTQGWVLDMPDSRGILRLETANANRMNNGTIQSQPGVLRPNRWQHVAAIVRRGENQAKLYVNGFEVAQGTISPADLNNPLSHLHIGRVQNANVYHGIIDEVRLYNRSIQETELQAMIEPGRSLATAPFPEGVNDVRLTLGNRSFAGKWNHPEFLLVRLPQGPLPMVAELTGGNAKVSQVHFDRIEANSSWGQTFQTFEQRTPKLGVHLGLRRDCGSTLSPVGSPQVVTSLHGETYTFEGTIDHYPSPDVEENNVNYLAGIREIGIRSEFTDGRDMPRLMIQSVTFEGPYLESWPPPHHRIIMGPSPADPTVGMEDRTRTILERFATRAFRRPITADEGHQLLRTWSDRYHESKDWLDSMRQTMAIVLTSPQFLFAVESSQSPESEELTSWELASKLSFFLWNGPPDPLLYEAAKHGTLRDELDQHVDRMIDDSKFERFADIFAKEWLSLDKLEVVETDRKRFPQLTKEVKQQLHSEPSAFFKYLIVNNKTVKDWIAPDFLIANEVTAHYYGLASQCESGFEFRAIPNVDPLSRFESNVGGVLTHAGILAGLSDGRESNPVKRGAWFAKKIIAEPPDDPPPNVPKLDDLSQKTLRERLEIHRNAKGCSKCHQGIDPWGVALEQFDASGRTKSIPYDARSELPDGTQVSGYAELRNHLVNDRLDQIAYSTYKHLMIYALGRSLHYNELETIRHEIQPLRNDGYPLRDMLHRIVRSELFLSK